MIYAIDFDGTLCEKAWPNIGEPIEEALEAVRELDWLGHTIIIWTCREKARLAEAVAWLVSHEVPFDYVNQNDAERTAFFANDSRKIGADRYIDDKNAGSWSWRDVLEEARSVETCGHCARKDCKTRETIKHTPHPHCSDWISDREASAVSEATGGIVSMPAAANVIPLTSVTVSAPNTFEDALRTISAECDALMVRKQRDYGHSNITTFGEQGVLIRLHDKLARLINLSKTGKEPSNEAIDDTWEDIRNYATIALMLRRGVFTLPLAEDTRPK